MENNVINEVTRFFKNVDYDKIIRNGELFLEQIKKLSVNASKETTRLMLELYFVMTSDKTSKFNKIVIGAALAYHFLPNDFMSKDDYGIFGVLDNAAVLYFAYKRVKKNVTPEIEKKVDDTLAAWAKSASEFTIMKPIDQRV